MTDNISISMNQQQRHTYLSAMGITVWQQRNKSGDHSDDKHVTKHIESNINKALEQTKNIDINTAITKKESLLHLLTPNTDKHDVNTTSSLSISEEQTAEKNKRNVTIDYPELDWASLKSTVTTCQKCVLAKARNQAIFGQGNYHASLMIIGDAPADDEDRQGLPFAGKAGELLTNMLLSINIQQHDVYLTNIIKCRPPNNRSPYKKELKQCDSFIHQQIKHIQPALILITGRVAAQYLLKSTHSLGQLRNKIHLLEQHNIPIIATYHPAYLLRQTSAKEKA